MPIRISSCEPGADPSIAMMDGVDQEESRDDSVRARHDDNHPFALLYLYHNPNHLQHHLHMHSIHNGKSSVHEPAVNARYH
jgi:hypothetical protein